MKTLPWLLLLVGCDPGSAPVARDPIASMPDAGPIADESPAPAPVVRGGACTVDPASDARVLLLHDWIDFGRVDAGATRCAPILLESTGTSDFAVCGVAMADGGAFSIDIAELPLEIAPGESASAAVVCFAPREADDRCFGTTVELSTSNGRRVIAIEGCVAFGDADADGFDHRLDCDDRRADVHPGATESCGNATDDDCDGLVDALDGECVAADAIAVTIGAPRTPGTYEHPKCREDEVVSRSHVTGVECSRLSVSIGDATYPVIVGTPRTPGSYERVKCRGNEVVSRSLVTGIQCSSLSVLIDGAEHPVVVGTPRDPGTYEQPKCRGDEVVSRVHAGTEEVQCSTLSLRL